MSTSCAPASSISTLHPQQAILAVSSNTTISTTFQTCCAKANGAYTSPENDCYSHCYYYNAAAATRFQSCFNKTLDNSTDFNMFVDTPLNSTITSSVSVQTLVPIVSATPSYAFSNSSSINTLLGTAISANSSSTFSSSNQTSSSSQSIVTSTALSTAAGSGSTQTSIVVAPGPSPTVGSAASGTSGVAAASSSKSDGVRRVRGSFGMGVLVGLAVLAVFV